MTDEEGLKDLQDNAGFFPSDTSMEDLIGTEGAAALDTLEATEGEAVVEPVVDPPTETTEVPETTEVVEETVDVPKFETDSPFIMDEVSELEIGSLEEAYTAFGELGYEVKSEADFAQVVTDIKTLRGSETELKGQVGELKDTAEFLAGIPDDLFQLLEDYRTGKDYRAAIKSMAGATIDFSKDIRDHDSYELFNFYYPDKFENKADYEESDSYDILQKAVADKYSGDKTVTERNNGNIAANLKQTSEAVSQSAVEAIKSLSFKDDHKVKVAEWMVDGPKGFMSKFVDDKGLWKPEAASMIAKLQFHDQTIKDYSSMVKKQNKMIQEFVKKAPVNPTVASSAANGQQAEIDAWAGKMFPSGNNQ